MHILIVRGSSGWLSRSVYDNAEEGLQKLQRAIDEYKKHAGEVTPHGRAEVGTEFKAGSITMSLTKDRSGLDAEPPQE